LVAKQVRKSEPLDQNDIGRYSGSSGNSAINGPRKLHEWAVEVVEALEDMRWKLVGHETFPGSSTRRPLYSMTNPNNTIDTLILK